MKEFSVSIRKGIDDLISWSPYANASDWPVFRPHYELTEEEYVANPKEYEERIKAVNEQYVKQLKDNGTFGELHTTNFMVNEIPEFDEPKYPLYSNYGILIPTGNHNGVVPPKMGVEFKPKDDEKDS